MPDAQQYISVCPDCQYFLKDDNYPLEIKYNVNHYCLCSILQGPHGVGSNNHTRCWFAYKGSNCNCDEFVQFVPEYKNDGGPIESRFEILDIR